MDNFWRSLPKPIIGLAPMDGVTDAAFRYITDTYGKPDVLFTEFIPVEAIDRGITRVLNAFVHHKTRTPTVAQIFGHDLRAFYKATIVTCEMGFNGIDINMGCPDKHVVARGGGAALILEPKHAQKIIAMVKKATRDWFDGLSLNSIGLSNEIISFITLFRKKFAIKVHRTLLPVSIKTRIGYDRIITKQWLTNLIETKPEGISLHGRTLKQLYSGKANWEEIGKGASLCVKEDIVLLGNGDIKSINEALQKIKDYKTHGVLIGRASLGNPWIFKKITPTQKKRFKVLIEHTKQFIKFRRDLKLFPMRKHFTWYCKGFKNSALVRNELMKVSSLNELNNVLLSHRLIS
ncbi:tRNA-dihydrouridine synthase [Candidatus Roizmanbacteria bacterium]|nr:tRNA-dihydrouridine synthase [Candidatus Roizmanbacteria bacterium]